ncbi:cob(I)yrinic acid a,c-diamide adenosyltransferase [Corynebacterium sp. sy017]|uniref:cob(I)yrinic acid a,c-diamide adenosyltransferase n=1 Tax=unclassified Corynebacterium TaxID=2624378 RepID=UPI001185E6A8|nr:MULTISPECIES: cob(I)yrinic acid a,c-diamide adenosyltransferase [unclassified Corynebacterium]MBP3087838.1 cob(I)yrinic acid a,c-diamide adenosyltransferase [Corynebacterium sp. sy017]QDZ42807.1 cob(I)yrinic acid a,c-diamide adenosyltransferase [Corynebacterium sp. sy039]TSD92381.1 cob(I)yrinic acid a,c-diamide adenosyltransferase [Corynebacterium sp. SY003]
MPQGKVDPKNIPNDGLTTKQRRQLPITAIHTGDGKGKSTAAFGMALRAWNQGLNIGVFQFVKSAKWRVGEESVFRTLAQLHEDTAQGGAVQWHKMGEGWSWARKQGAQEDHAHNAAAGWEEIKRRLAQETHDFYVLDEFTYPIKWGWIDVEDVVETLKSRPGTQHVVITGRDAHPRLIEVADLVTRMEKIKHPMDQGRKGQKGIEW